MADEQKEAPTGKVGAGSGTGQSTPPIIPEKDAVVNLTADALAYAARGWYVFPCRPDKSPYLAHGFLDASTDPDTIDAWFEFWPDAAIGIACGASGLVVVDCDVKRGIDGVAHFEALQISHDDALHAQTPTGGLHIVYAAGDILIHNSAGRAAPGIDIRGDGGYIIAPPSRVATGTYRALDDWSREPGKVPAALVRLLVSPGGVSGDIPPDDWEPTLAEPLPDVIPEGQRDATLASLAGTMRRRGASEAAIAAALRVENKARCNPPLPEKDVLRIAKSVSRYEPAADLSQESASIPTPADVPADDASGAPTTATKPKSPPKVPVSKYQRAFLDLGYRFRLNDAGDILEVNGKRLDDFELSAIRARMRERGFTSAAAVQDVMCMTAAQNRYHPIRQYLTANALTWDGNANISFLAGHFDEVTTPHKLLDVWLRKWLIGAVAKAMDGHKNQNAMLVLDGPQSTGKSTFAKWLCSPLPDYFNQAPINPDDKDCLLRLASSWIWEVSELGATTRKADVEGLKAFLTRQVITVRRPYGRLDIVKPALASFIGTVNDSAGFLSDSTGNRRFLTATIRAINWNYAKNLDPNQIWAEAFAAFAAGEAWELTPAERALLEDNNQGFRTENPIAGYLNRYFEIDPDDTGHWMATADVVATLIDRGYRGASTRSIAMEVAATLREMGLEKSKRRQGSGPTWGYTGIWIATIIP